MDNWWRNLQYGLRLLARNKGFTAIAVLALALGIGPNVAIFSIIWATFLAPLPYPDADRLVVVWTLSKGERNGTRGWDYAQYLAQSRSFQRLDLQSWNSLHLTNADHLDEGEFSGLPITPGMLTKNLGSRMAMGRDFLPDEGRPGNDRFVILSHRLWRERFHNDRAILGRPILIADEPFIVVGVLEPGPQDRDAIFYVPQAVTDAALSQAFGDVIGRLKPGVTITQAQAEMSVINRRLAPSRPGDKSLWTIRVEPLKNDWLDRQLQRNLWLLLAAVGFVLLIACANVANLLLARGSARRQELAVRAALGAPRRQVVAQLLTENLLLATLGGAIGVALGWGIMKAAMAILPDLNRQTAEAVVEVNVPVLCFALAVTLLGGVLFGCAPALQAARVNLVEALNHSSRSGSGHGRMRLQAVLVMAEFSLALVLLAGAGMALHSFWNITQIDPGVRTDRVLTGLLQPQIRGRQSGPFKMPPQQEILTGQRQLVDSLRSVPGVTDVALATTTPLTGAGTFPFAIVGQPVDWNHAALADFEAVSPEFFRTFAVRLARGRFLSEKDTLTSPRVIMVNETFVRRYLSGADPLTQRLLLPQFVPSQNRPTPPLEWQIVGVFHDILNDKHLTGKPQPAMYVSLCQFPWPYVGIAVHTAIDPASLTQDLRRRVAQALPGYSLTRVQTMQQIVNSQMTRDRFSMVLFGGFAGVALLLAALGIYGVMAYAVAQRTHEIGVRMALGAETGEVVFMMLQRGLKLELAGAAIGLIAAAVLGRLMRSTLYGVAGVDYASLSAVAVLLLSVGAIASWLPARRTAQVDPVIALRDE
jgi:putative ABC transport system permease protein